MGVTTPLDDISGPNKDLTFAPAVPVDGTRRKKVTLPYEEEVLESLYRHHIEVCSS
jgi:hypothetical protein